MEDFYEEVVVTVNLLIYLFIGNKNQSIFNLNIFNFFYLQKEVPKQQPKPEEKPAQPQEGSEMNQEKVDPKPTVEAKPETEIQKKKKTRHSKLKVDKELLHQSTDKEIQNFFEIEAKMFNQDRLVTETHEKKNELESYVYDLRQKLADSHKSYTPPGEDVKLLNLLSENETWLYGEGATASKGQYIKRIEAVQAIWNPILKRSNIYRELPSLIQDLLQTVSGWEQLAQSTVIFTNF